MSESDERSALARQIVSGLKEIYPDATCALRFETPLDLLVATILSAQCTDERVNIVTADLFRRYHTAADYAAAPQEVLEEEVHSTGFFRQKARAIREMAQRLLDDYDGEVPRTIEELVTLPGTARKTANVVLGTAYSIASGIAVDTHVRRLAQRMGLTDEEDPERIERDLMALVPREEWVRFSHAMILHGRQVCAARAPACTSCGLRDICPKRIASPRRPAAGTTRAARRDGRARTT